MNATEFRAVLDWWMCSDPWPKGVDREVIARLLTRESVTRGYTDWLDAYHRHKAEGAQQS